MAASWTASSCAACSIERHRARPRQPTSARIMTAGVRVIARFFAYSADSADGVTVAAADVNGGNLCDIVTGPERGAPLVKVFEGGNLALLSSFFAYNPRVGSGVYVAAVAARGDHR